MVFVRKIVINISESPKNPHPQVLEIGNRHCLLENLKVLIIKIVSDVFFFPATPILFGGLTKLENYNLKISRNRSFCETLSTLLMIIHRKLCLLILETHVAVKY